MNGINAKQIVIDEAVPNSEISLITLPAFQYWKLKNDITKKDQIIDLLKSQVNLLMTEKYSKAVVNDRHVNELMRIRDSITQLEKELENDSKNN